jgi:uncharacterized protein (TIGR00369 family)
MSSRTVRDPTPPPPGEWERWLEWADALPNLSEIGLRAERIGAGDAVVILERPVLSLNPNGGVNGGLICAAADQAMGVVALTALKPGSLPATATLHAEFLRPAFPPLTFKAAVSQSGRRLVFVSVDVEDVSGRLCVRVTGTMAAQSRF